MTKKKEETKTTTDFITATYGIDGLLPVETTEKEMSVYSALQKRKLYMKQLDDLKSKGIDRGSAKYVSFANAKATHVGAIPLEDYKNSLKGNYDKNIAILTNYHNINAAISQSNATTRIKIGDATYTVTEAIARYVKISEEIEFLNKIITECVYAQSKVTAFNEEKLSPERIDTYVNNTIAALPDVVTQSLGSTDSVDELREKYRDKYIEENTMVLIDPYDHVNKIKDRAEKLEEFKETFNEALNICNMQTIIKVNLVN